MSADWQVSDLALCVDDSGLSDGGGLCAGRVYTVGSVLPDAHFLNGNKCLSIELSGVRRGNYRHQGFGTWRFRKIRPDEHQACEPEFVTLLKRVKRTVKA